MLYHEKFYAAREKRCEDPDEVKLRNIVDMALGFSAMMRLFEKGAKKIIKSEILRQLPAVFSLETEEAFQSAHHDFCLWGMGKIVTAEKKRKGEVIKRAGPPSYGQMAKTLDVVLHVVIHYAQQPDRDKAAAIARWLNSAMDTKMMAFLVSRYPDALESWPKRIEEVGEIDYMAIQLTVRRFIQEKHLGKILPVQFDDIYWEMLNRGS